MAGAGHGLNHIRVLLLPSGWDGNRGWGGGAVRGIVVGHFKKFQVK